VTLHRRVVAQNWNQYLRRDVQRKGRHKSMKEQGGTIIWLSGILDRLFLCHDFWSVVEVDETCMAELCC
jgi:hypothetical protein